MFNQSQAPKCTISLPRNSIPTWHPHTHATRLIRPHHTSSVSSSSLHIPTFVKFIHNNKKLHLPKPTLLIFCFFGPMASLAIFTPTTTTTVKGLGGSSLAGTKLNLMPSRRSLKPTSYRAGAVVAKYGDKSVYFDLEDLGNTTGQWDVYGSDAPSPYNPLQSKFFETFAAPFTKRGLLLKFLILGGGSTLAYFSSTATGDVLPIVKGPQQKPKLGPRGKI